MSDPRAPATSLLQRSTVGEPTALAGLTAVVYDELRHLAAAYLQRERIDHSLQPTALVHEAFLKLVDVNSIQVNDRKHFFALAATMMRRVLVEHARSRNAVKRGGGGAGRISLSGLQASDPDMEVVALDEAMTKLAAIDPRQAQIVELRFFGGLTVEEVAESLNVSKRTIESDWTLARAWLHRELTTGERS